MTKATTALSIQLRTGLDYLMALSVDDLNDIAEAYTEYAEEVEKHGKK